MPDTCTWKLDETAWHTYWEPSCGDHPFEFNEGGPVENGFRYCPYCGKPIKEIAHDQPI